MTFFRLLLPTLAALALGACSATLQSTPGVALDRAQSWVLLPLVNNTETAQAALSAEAMLEPLLQAQGIHDLKIYPNTVVQDSLFEPTERKVVDEALRWAKAQGARYGLSGSVQEWRYKAGIDGEPVVGVTLRVIDLASGNVLWSVTGSQSGWGRDALSGTAQTLLTQMLARMPAGQ